MISYSENVHINLSYATETTTMGRINTCLSSILMVVIFFLRETLFIERNGSGLCWCLVGRDAGFVSGEISRNCQSGDLPQAQIQMLSFTDFYL